MTTRRFVWTAAVAAGGLLAGAVPAVVAEAGRGGAGPCQPGPEGGTVCFGRSGAITVVQHGRQRRLVDGLPSRASQAGTDANGPSDVAVGADGRVVYAVGLGGNPDLRTTVGQLSGMAQLYQVGRRHPRADLGAYEKKANPDRAARDTNPTAVLAVRQGEIAVDAGGNSLLWVGRNGRVAAAAVFPARMVPGPDGKRVRMESVPTSVVRGPDGAYYVGELTGFPFPAGQARVWRFEPGRAPQVYATGFTNIIDLAWGPKGLYVLEISHRGLLSGDRTGALLRVARRGPHQLVVSTGLTSPAGLAIRGGFGYVANCGTCKGTGTVVRYRLS